MELPAENCNYRDRNHFPRQELVESGVVGVEERLVGHQMIGEKVEVADLEVVVVDAVHQRTDHERAWVAGLGVEAALPSALQHLIPEALVSVGQVTANQGGDMMLHPRSGCRQYWNFDISPSGRLCELHQTQYQYHSLLHTQSLPRSPLVQVEMIALGLEDRPTPLLVAAAVEEHDLRVEER